MTPWIEEDGESGRESKRPKRVDRETEEASMGLLGLATGVGLGLQLGAEGAYEITPAGPSHNSPSFPLPRSLYSPASLPSKLSHLFTTHALTISCNPLYFPLLSLHPIPSRLPALVPSLSSLSTGSRWISLGANGMDPFVVGAASYVWGRRLSNLEVSEVARVDEGLWRVVGELAKVARVNRLCGMG